MDLWKIRNQALTDPNLTRIHATLIKGFRLIDDGLKLLEPRMGDHDLARFTALFGIKGRYLLLGCYSMALDGVGQESGALLRPLIEVIEKIAYLRKVPDAVTQAREDKLPSAGAIAKAIQGSFQRLRGYLNEHASHVRISEYALQHLVRVTDTEFTLILHPAYGPISTRANLISVAAFQMFLAAEIAENADLVSGCPDELANAIEEYRQQVIAWQHEQVAQHQKGRKSG